MDFYVYDTNLNRVGIIDNYTSVIWARRYNDAGDFEIYIQSSPEVLEMCVTNRYIVRDDDKTVMIIKSVAQSESTENGDYITITGVSIESIIEQRIVWYLTNLQGRIEECIYTLIDVNCINPTDENRVIPHLKLSPLKHLTKEIELTNYTGANVLDAVKQLCVAAEYGFKITFDDGAFVFEVYEGVNRTRNQTENTYVIFDADNLTETTYTNDSTQYKNVALVGGGGEGVGRVFMSYGNAAGVERFETFVEETSTTDKLLLFSAGRDNLQEMRPLKSFDGEISDYDNGYDLGDIVEIENKYNISATARVIEIIQSIDESGIYTIPTFSEWGLK